MKKNYELTVKGVAPAIAKRVAQEARKLLLEDIRRHITGGKVDFMAKSTIRSVSIEEGYWKQLLKDHGIE